jgi:hypothetical protein
MHDEISEAIRAYLEARKRFLAIAKKYPDEIGGNDNIIGRIGEYLALRFLRSKGRSPRKTALLSQAGFDLEDGEIKISVKILTAENKKGRVGRLKEPWHELVVIDLSADLSGTIGFITRAQFNDAYEKNPGWRADPAWRNKPLVRASMLRPKGLIHDYGVVAKVDSFL